MNLIGTPKYILMRGHRRYYCYDEKGRINDYEHQVTIDTMYINCLLPPHLIDVLLNKYNSKGRHKGNGYYGYMFKRRGIAFLIYGYNGKTPALCCIQLQREITVAGEKPELWRDLLTILEDVKIKHYIRRVDVAFDFIAPPQNSIHLSRKTNMRRKHYKHGMYVGSTRSKSKTTTICHYNREKNKGAVFFEFANRLEARMHFKQKDGVRINNLRNELFVERLQKEVFIVEFPKVDTLTVDEKRLLINYKKANNQDLIKQHKASYRKIKSKLKMHRYPLERSYRNHVNRLYNFLNRENYKQSKKRVLQNKKIGYFKEHYLKCILLLDRLEWTDFQKFKELDQNVLQIVFYLNRYKLRLLRKFQVKT